MSTISFAPVDGWQAYYDAGEGQLIGGPIVGVATDEHGTLHFVDVDSDGYFERVDEADNLAFVVHESRAFEARQAWAERERR